MKKDTATDVSPSLAVEENATTVVEKNPEASEHRISCHRCGNIRKQRLVCSSKACPHIFCKNCSNKMKDEYGTDIFTDGCPVCKEMCCCSNRSISCRRLNHCYRKCPASKNRAACTVYKEELARTSISPSYLPKEKSNGVLDLLAAVADNQLSEQIAAANGKRKLEDLDSGSSSPEKIKSKAEDITSNPAFGFDKMTTFFPLPAILTGESSSLGLSPPFLWATPHFYSTGGYPTAATSASGMVHDLKSFPGDAATSADNDVGGSGLSSSSSSTAAVPPHMPFHPQFFLFPPYAAGPFSSMPPQYPTSGSTTGSVGGSASAGSVPQPGMLPLYPYGLPFAGGYPGLYGMADSANNPFRFYVSPMVPNPHDPRVAPTAAAAASAVDPISEEAPCAQDKSSAEE